MKIVYVSDAIYPYNKGGKEKRLYEISTRLAKQGHDVHIYTMHWWDGPEKAICEDGVQLHAISRLYNMYDGDRRSIKEGILFGFACLKLISVKFDILDVDHMPFFPVISAWIVCTLRHRRLYGTWHEALTREDWVTYMGPSGNVAAAIERICIKMPHVITAASKQTKELLNTYHKRNKRIDLVASGVDLKKMETIKPNTESCDVLYVGRLVKGKNIDTLIRAVSIIAEKVPTVRCVIIGGGVEKQNLVKLIDQLGLSKNVSIINPIQDANDVYACMKSAKVFVLPSVREGFGIVALESLACNTPVITIDVPANAAKDLIKNQDMGSVVPLDAQAIADQIRHRMAKETKPRISQHVAEFDWNSLANHQAEVYAS
jgi:glycosyltransferase involved in cell wall biosynthesis